MIDDRALADQLQRIARAAAAVLVFVYCAGYEFGAFIHHLNDQLAGIKPPVVLPPMQHPFAGLAAELECLTVRELRTLTGLRKGRKSDLIAALLAK